MGCAARRPAPAPAVLKPPPPAEPWINAKSFCILPLSAPEVPRTGGQLVESLLNAWKAGLKLPAPERAVTIVGGRYPSVREMRVDLSGARVMDGKSRPQVGDLRPTTRSLAVEHFALVAEDFATEKSRANLQVTADGVKLDLQKDRRGTPVLVMTDADEGTLHFDTAVADMERLMLSAARASAGRRGVYVRDLKLYFRTAGPRSLYAEMYVTTLVGFVPAGLRFTARVDVDEAMNARLSDLAADGDELLGPVVVAFIRPQLKKFDGQTKPLVGFPNKAVRLKDVQITAGDRITLDAVFGK